MERQASLALAPPAGAAHWHGRTPFDARILETLGDVNAAFLRALRELHLLRPGTPAFGLPGHLVAPLGLDRPVAAEQLRLPFALFDLRFRDTAFWAMQAASTASVHDAADARPADPRLVVFARPAVTLAWHVAQLDPRVARLALGTEPGTTRVLRDLPLGALDGLARRVAGVVTARFSIREPFWRLLAASLRAPGDEGLRARVRLLGLQLQAADAARVQRLHRRTRRSTQA